MALGPGGTCVLCRRKYQVISASEPGMGLVGGLTRLVLFVGFAGGLWWAWHHFVGAAQDRATRRQAVHAKLYTKADCSDCETMRAWLRKENVNFEEVDTDEYADPLQEIAENCDVKGLPVIDFGGECASAPLDEDQAMAALDRVADKLAAEASPPSEEGATQP